MSEKMNDWHIHTQIIEDGYFNQVENDSEAIWKDLGDIRKRIDSNTWKAHFKRVVDSYNISCRFAIMRILFDINTEIPAEKIDEKAINDGFSVEGFGAFKNITAEHAKDLTAKEVQNYKMLLLRRVEDNNPNEKNAVAPLIDRALEVTKKGEKSALDRKELLELAHAIDLDLKQAQFLLLRVSGDNEAGFSFSKSDDLIDIYGFIRRIPSDHVRELKNWYEDWYKKNKIKKISYEEKPEDWTRDVYNSFIGKATKWNANDHKEMKQWLRANASHLDVGSKTAFRVYRNLAACAYSLCEGNSNYALGNTVNYVKEPCYQEYTRKVLFENGRISKNLCKKLSDTIFLYNRDLVAGNDDVDAKALPGDNTKLLSQIHNDKGAVSVNGTLNKSRTRVADILEGKMYPTKGDILLLVWFIAGISWEGAETVDNNAKCDRLMEFIDTAGDILELALLPAFYPANILEEAMMTSIVIGDSNNSPSMIYEQICEAFTNRGQVRKTPGSRKHTYEEKKRIVEASYRKNGNVKEIAESLGITKASLNNWRTEYAKALGIKRADLEKWMHENKNGILK